MWGWRYGHGNVNREFINTPEPEPSGVQSVQYWNGNILTVAEPLRYRMSRNCQAYRTEKMDAGMSMSVSVFSIPMPSNGCITNHIVPHAVLYHIRAWPSFQTSVHILLEKGQKGWFQKQGLAMFKFRLLKLLLEKLSFKIMWPIYVQCLTRSVVDLDPGPPR
jgi:hypothetical protein